MPNRYVRESAIDSEAVDSLSPGGEVFWRRMINKADDFGRFTGNPKLLRSNLFPLRTDHVTLDEIAGWLAECLKAGLIFPYEANGKPFIVMNNWEKGRAHKSEYPDPPVELCEQMKTYVYRREHIRSVPTPTPIPVPDSDPDSLSDSGTGSDSSGSESREIPSEQQVKTKAQFVGLAEWKALDWFYEMEGCGWVDFRGRPIAKWEPVLLRVKAKWEADGRPKGPPGRPEAGLSIRDLQNVMQAKQRIADGIKAKFSSQVAMGFEWSDQGKRKEYVTIMAEIRQLNEKIARTA